MLTMKQIESEGLEVEIESMTVYNAGQRRLMETSVDQADAAFELERTMRVHSVKRTIYFDITVHITEEEWNKYHIGQRFHFKLTA